MREAAICVFLLLFVICGGSLMIYRNPPPPDPKPLSALQVDALKERFPDGELEYPYRFRACRNEVWWYFYANHDALPSTRNCW